LKLPKVHLLGDITSFRNQVKQLNYNIYLYVDIVRKKER